MARRTRATAFTRFLLLLAFMAALFFGVQYVLTATEWGRTTQQELLEAARDANDE